MNRGNGLEALRASLQAHVDGGGLLLGEAVGTHGIAAGVTGAGVRRTTLSENATVGEAVGAALTGARVVVELLDPVGLARCGDALADASSLPWRSKAAWSAPIVILAPWAQAPRVLPGVDLLVLSSADDAGDVLARAFASGRPTVVLTCEDALHGAVGEGVATAGARVVTEADATKPGVTLLAAGPGVSLAMAAAATRNVTVVDLRALAPLDLATLGAAVRRTGRVVLLDLPDVLAPAVREGFLSLESPPAVVPNDAGALAAAIDAALTY